MTTAAEPKTITMQEYFDLVADSISEKDLQEALTKPIGDITRQYTQDCDAVAVSYLSNQDVLCLNPVAWARTSYSISDIYQKGDYKLKVMVGDED